MKLNLNFLSVVLLLFIAFFITYITKSAAQSVQNTRVDMEIPDIDGFITLKCDLHLHTSFSDGVVWPSYRVEEAWMDGLDAISITDHIEYTPHSEYVKIDHNAPYELGIKTALIHNIILIKGTEITKRHPGHFNALFIKDASKIANDDYKIAIEEANRQGAFVILNHPREAVTDNRDWWTEELNALFENGQLHGIEIFNWNDYYPGAFDLALDKNFTILSNTDMHKGSEYYKSHLRLKHRPMTLVFAKERSVQGIKEALDDGRTAGYFKNSVYGKEELVKELFLNSIRIKKAHYSDTGSGNAFVEISNISDIQYTLIPLNQNKKSDPIQLEARESSIISVPMKKAEESITIEYEVENILISSSEKLKINLVFRRD